MVYGLIKWGDDDMSKVKRYILLQVLAVITGIGLVMPYVNAQGWQEYYRAAALKAAVEVCKEATLSKSTCIEIKFDEFYKLLVTRGK